MNIIKDMKTGFLAALVLYFVALAGTAVASRKKSRSLEDFFLASKSLSPVLMALSLCAAWFGASSILVSADEAWRAGASAFGIVGLPAILTLLLYVAFFVRRIHTTCPPFRFRTSWNCATAVRPGTWRRFSLPGTW